LFDRTTIIWRRFRWPAVLNTTKDPALTYQLLREGPVLVAALLAVAALTYVFAKSPVAAVWTLVTTFAMTEAIVPPLELQMTVGGFSLYALDLVTALMFAIGVFRLLTWPTPKAVSLPLLALSVAFLFHVVWGANAFGLQEAVNSSRLWLAVLGPLVYCAQAPRAWSRESFLPLIAGAAALAAFALLQIARHGLYGATEYIYIGGQYVDARPVNADGALLIVECLLIALAGRFVRSAWWLIVIATLGATVLLLQYRTEWIIALMVGTVAYVRWARVAIYVNERAAAFTAAAVLLVSPVVLTLVASASAFNESIETATGQESTLGWRTASWGSLIQAHSSPEEVFLGIPTGTSLERQVGGLTATESPHNLYVDALLSFGILGPVAVMWLWLLIVRNRQQIAAGLGLSAVAVVLLVASQAVFGITNMLGPLQGVLLGMLLQAAWIGRRTTAEARASAIGFGGNDVTDTTALLAR
jgi:hypothetical protein